MTVTLHCGDCLDHHLYDGRLWVVQSHLKAARDAAVKLYEANPMTHGLPPMDELVSQIESLEREIQFARNASQALRQWHGDRR